ncbi:hypothetical protein LIER_37085 [Lithospermum erythrorhizon]|uniref:RNase H type-1 domain-containing protein n=1 Tax=Lithospermum erythrorhizon TaxID=34254 RepID=A0AAV3PG03_LITER
MEYALGFSFETTNNETEYEAMIAVLMLVKSLGIQQVLVRGDSKLIMDQIKGECGVKNETLIKYHEKEVQKRVVRQSHRGQIFSPKNYQTGFFWPTLAKNAMAYVKKCDVCQKLSTISQKPPSTPLVSLVPLEMWGINLVGKLPTAK